MTEDLQKLDQEIRQLQNKRRKKWGFFQKPVIQESTSEGYRLFADIILSPVAAAVIGHAIDRWLETAPWGILCGIFLGLTAAGLSLYRISRGTNDQNNKPPQ